MSQTHVSYPPLGTSFLARYGPHALVTGASDGIGREIARALAASGLGLVLVARRGERLERLADELRAKHRVEVRVIAADLSRAEDVTRVIDETASIDLGLFVAAAGFGTSGAFLEAELEDELSMLDVNCRAVIAMTHALGRRLASRGRGGVVLFSSLLAFQGVPRAAHYAATKAFNQVFAEGLRRELAPRGVDVLACAPGPIASGFGARADMQMGMAIPATLVPMPTLRALGRRTTVRPGWLSWLLELSLSTLPRWGRTWVLARIMAGMTQHHA
jgi:short-subunit dehydrogenase